MEGNVRADFGVVAQIDLGEGPDPEVRAILQKQEDGFRLFGKAEFAKREFELGIAVSKDDKLIVGSFDGRRAPFVINVRELAMSISPDIGEFVPSFEIELRAAAFVLTKGAVLFGVELGTDIDLAGLPVVGSQVTGAGGARLDRLRLVVTSADLTDAREPIAAALAHTAFALPPPAPSGDTLPAGADLSARLQLGDREELLTIPIRKPAVPPKVLARGQGNDPNNVIVADELIPPPANKPARKDDGSGVKWFDLNKTIGPVNVDRVGFKMADSRLKLLVTGGFMLGPLKMSVDGLGVSNPLTKFDPEFHLNGLAISFKNGPIEIMGALLYNETDNSFVGMATITLPSLSITALGGYQKIDGEASLFLYAVLKKPLGGPPFFFVTGLALGFGYNRRLILPQAENVASFPFVEAAMSPGSPADPMAMLRTLSDVVPAARGQMFFAIGIKFNSFKLIDSFALLVVQTGDELVIDLLGISAIKVPADLPAGKTPIVSAELALRASINLTKKSVFVRGVLTANSFVIDRSCRLTGGFGFAAWFDGANAGDFVVTLGGYHPEYDVPKHYPRVPRVGLRWRVSSKLVIEGGMYMALTPNAVMAGGELKALFKSGGFEAGFEMGAHFLFSWQPYFYRASVYVSFRVKFKWFKLSIGASLEIWGPEFGGKAKVKVGPFKVSVKFGADKNPPPAISWPKFQEAFLPPVEERVSIAISSGLTEEIKGISIVDPAQMLVDLSTVLPIKQGVDGVGGKSFGIESMHLNDVHLSSIDIKVFKGDGEYRDFTATPVLKNAPVALWGKHNSRSDKKLVDGLLLGYQLTPPEFRKPDTSAERWASDFAFDLEKSPKAFASPEAESAGLVESTYTEVGASMRAKDAVARRSKVLATMGVMPKSDTPSVDLSSLLKDPQAAFVRCPRVRG